MSPIAHVIIEILAGGGLISLCLKLYKDKRRNLENGKINKVYRDLQGRRVNQH